MIRLPSDLDTLLRESGLPWRIETGGSHFKIMIEDQYVDILPKSNRLRMTPSRAHKNILARVRRVIKQRQERQ